jgi:hypothetical protein
MDEIWQRAWLFLASTAGGIAALSMRPWKQMGPAEIGLTVFVSMSFGVFVAPALIKQIWGDLGADTMAGIAWVLSAGSHVLIPLVIRRFGAVISTENEHDKR